MGARGRVAVFAVFAAPVVLSGQATFAGYIKLDDTATYFAMTDRVMEHGRSLAGLAPSTYEETLRTTLALGYPTGSLMPLGIGGQLLSYDVAWLFQPYLSFLAALLALSLYSILERPVASRPQRALAAFAAAQPAILFGYSLWGGVKELAGAFLLALIAGASALDAGRAPRRPRHAAARGRRRRARLRPQPAGSCLARARTARGSRDRAAPDTKRRPNRRRARCRVGGTRDPGDRRRGRLAAARSRVPAARASSGT